MVITYALLIFLYIMLGIGTVGCIAYFEDRDPFSSLCHFLYCLVWPLMMLIISVMVLSYCTMYRPHDEEEEIY